ncbi:MAG: MBL fold metallo-hydrolase [Bacteroidia bacterium]|nr:MBL fold metallo-hydrolase [Bacteroidia bacterium]
MSLYTASINSGSNGNCYYIGNETDAVLVDAGLSCRETIKRMEKIGLSMDLVRAIFVSHEHSDHIRGLVALARKFDLPVYITADTLRRSGLPLDKQYIVPFTAYKPVEVGGIKVYAFPKAHDASDPHSFLIEYKGIKIGVLTDIGVVCSHVTDSFKQCHAAFLEANYDDVMLAQGRYPYHLKKRIRGGNGHLSNAQALELFTKHKPAHMSHVFLSHLSKDNNCPDLARELFEANAGNTKVVVASRFNETEVYHISSESGLGAASYPGRAVQASLF